MKRLNVQEMTVEQLVQRYIVIGVDQDKAMRRRDHAKFNRLFDEMDAIENELKARDGDQRRVLLNLYAHPNPHVRLNAAKATLVVAPELARGLLQPPKRASPAECREGDVGGGARSRTSDAASYG